MGNTQKNEQRPVVKCSVNLTFWDPLGFVDGTWALGAANGLASQFPWLLAARPWAGHLASLVLFLPPLDTGVLFSPS